MSEKNVKLRRNLTKRRVGYAGAAVGLTGLITAAALSGGGDSGTADNGPTAEAGVQVQFTTYTGAREVTLTALLEDVERGEVERAWIDETADQVLVAGEDLSVEIPERLQPSEDEVAAAKERGEPLLEKEFAAYPSDYASELLTILSAKGVPVQVYTPGAASSSGFPVVVAILLITFLVGGIVWVHRRASAVSDSSPSDLGHGPSAGEATAGGSGRIISRSGDKSGPVAAPVPETRFADVAGCDEAIEQLQEMVEFLRDPDRFEDLGAIPPKGALLTGPPGTGKTLLARAVAGEAGVAFYAAAGSDFTEMYVGVGAKRVRDLFEAARRQPKAIVFIDEVDAIGKARSAGGGGGDSERDNTLIALLNEMDGFKGSNVIVLAATNRPEVLDKALTRPGRLDRRVEVPNPDRAARQRILEVHAKRRPLGRDVDLNLVARRTPGFSGADLASVVNEAAMVSARRGQSVIDAKAFSEAVAMIAMGRARSSALVTEHDRTVTAWHEAGHTLMALLQRDADDPVAVSIVPRGPAGGVTWMGGSDDLFMSRAKAWARLGTALGGRAAEELLLDGEYTQGAHGDLDSATNLALAMVTQYGMGPRNLAIRSGQLLAAGGATLDEVTADVEWILAEARDRARLVLGEYRFLVEAVASALLEDEDLGHLEIVAAVELAWLEHTGVPAPTGEIVAAVTSRFGSPVPEVLRAR